MPTPHTEQTRCRISRIFRSGKCQPTSKVRPMMSRKSKEEGQYIPHHSHWLHHQKCQRVWCARFNAVVGCERAGSITGDGGPQDLSRLWHMLTTWSLGHRVCPTGGHGQVLLHVAVSPSSGVSQPARPRPAWRARRARCGMVTMNSWCRDSGPVLVAVCTKRTS